MSRARSDAGFSLVEALVALAVFAMAGVALVQLQTHSLRTLAGAESRALGAALVQNTLVEAVAAREKPGLGAREQDVQFAGRDWRVSVIVAATPDPSTRRISVAAHEASAGTFAAQTHAFMIVPEGAQ